MTTTEQFAEAMKNAYATKPTAQEASASAFDEWAILELMGHRRLAGRVSEATVAGQSFVRLDIPTPDGTGVALTQLYSGAAIYCITPTSEDIARRVAAHAQPAPVARWELEMPESPEAF